MRIKILILLLIPIGMFGQANLKLVRTNDSTFTITNQNIPVDTLWKFTADYLFRYESNVIVDTIGTNGGGGGLTEFYDANTQKTVTDTLHEIDTIRGDLEVLGQIATNNSVRGDTLKINEGFLAPYHTIQDNGSTSLLISRSNNNDWIKLGGDEGDGMTLSTAGEFALSNSTSRISFIEDTLYADGTNGSTEIVGKWKQLGAEVFKGGYAELDSAKIAGVWLYEIDTSNRLEGLDLVESDTGIFGGDTITGGITLKEAVEAESFEHINFDTAVKTYSEGQLWYSNADNGLNFNNDLSEFNWTVGREVPIRFINNTGSTINAGTLVRGVGAYERNGVIIFEADLAGNGSIDSLIVVAVATTTAADGEEGEAIRMGQVNNLNTSAFNVMDILYAGANGTLTNISPEPPFLNTIIAVCLNSHATNGSIYVSPVGETTYRPKPTFSALFSRESEVIDITVQNQFELITNATNDLFTEDINYGFTLQGDSISVKQPGLYNVAISYSFIGDASQNDIWRIGVFLNGVEEYSTTRTSSTTNAGGVPFSKDIDINVGDWITFKIANTTNATRDCSFYDSVINISFLTSE